MHTQSQVYACEYIKIDETFGSAMAYNISRESYHYAEQL